VFGRLNYDWEQKYLFDRTIRRDGSSRFGEGHRFGTFGAVGLGWIFTQETFLKGFKALSFGKLRGSYGITGNDQIPNYQYYMLYSSAPTAYQYSGTSVYYPSNIANPDLHWETTRKLDIAAELGFFKDRILIKADYYQNRTNDLLANIPLPAQSGLSSYVGNIPAVVQNRGWEFELNTITLNGKDFKWTTKVNLTINRNKLVSYADLATSSYSQTYAIGQPVDVQFLYHFTGVNSTTGLPTLQDVDGDGSYTFADKHAADIGHPFYGGINQ